jgi:hypothetical protein
VPFAWHGNARASTKVDPASAVTYEAAFLRSRPPQRLSPQLLLWGVSAEVLSGNAVDDDIAAHHAYPHSDKRELAFKSQVDLLSLQIP